MKKILFAFFFFLCLCSVRELSAKGLTPPFDSVKESAPGTKITWSGKAGEKLNHFLVQVSYNQKSWKNYGIFLPDDSPADCYEFPFQGLSKRKLYFRIICIEKDGKQSIIQPSLTK